MITFETIGKLESATLKEGDLVQVLGEFSEGDVALMTGKVYPALHTSSNRLVTIANGLKVEVFPTPLGDKDVTKKYVNQQDDKIKEQVNNLHTKREAIEWRSGLRVTDALQLYVHDGVEYLPDGNAVPFTTGAVFNADNWVLSELMTQMKQWRDVGDIRGWGAQTGINSTIACIEITNKINKMGGGTVLIKDGEFTVGIQSRSQSMYLSGSRVFDFKNCSNPINIIFDGATMRFADGLKFGAFNPDTGERYDHGAALYDYKYRADIGQMFSFENCTGGISITNANLDGNAALCDLGGRWGDLGRQCIGSGIRISKCRAPIVLQNINANNFPLDGLLVSGDKTFNNEIEQISMLNVSSRLNGRQGLTLSSATSFTGIGCNFSDTGRLTHSSGEVITTAPAAGVDIEAEQGGINRRITFINSAFTNNVGNQIVADSGDAKGIHLHDCTFYSPDGGAMWLKKPNTTLTNCTVIGTVTNISKGTIFDKCLFTDVFDNMSVNSDRYSDRYLVDTSGSDDTLFRDCTWECNFMRPITTAGSVVEMRDCTIDFKYANNDYLADGSYIILLRSGHYENLKIKNNLLFNPVKGFYIHCDNEKLLSGEIFNLSNSKISWNSVASGAGTWGVIDTAKQYVEYSSRSHRFNYYGFNRITNATTPPKSGEWKRGDTILNCNPSPSSVFGWTCTTSGIAGSTAVFKNICNIEG